MTSSVADALVGRVIDGRYRVLSHLADGGMASVYVAMDARLDRQVALKIMRPGLAGDAVFVERFRSEARAAARLSHPNVVAVFDQGEDGDDVFLAMELVHGKTLRDVIHEEAPLTAREALAILEPILGALRAAHTAGIIHRDVKPENVIVRRDGEVKVADFGLARAISNETTTSQTGLLLGTVSYLSPEQVERGAADQRSDVYAAGLLLFEMLTGTKAVTGDTPIQIAYKHVHGGVPKPSSIVATVPADLDELVADATAVEPDDRFSSAAEFLGAMRAVRHRLTQDQLDGRPSPTPTHPVGAGPVGVGPVGIGRVGVGPVDVGPVGVGPAGVGPVEAGPVEAGVMYGGVPRPELPGHPDAGIHERTATLPLLPEPAQAAALAHEGQGTRRGPARRRRRWPWWIAALVLVLGGGAGWWFTAGPGGTTRVPVLVNATLDDATASLQAASLAAESSDAFSEKVPAGRVISAQPASGTEVSKQTTVVLVVSKGPERYTVPNLVGTKASDVAGALGPLTLRSQVKQEWSETVPKGVVISQDPPADTPVKRNAAVSLVVSKGRQPIPVPDVRKLPVDAATKKLTDAGFTVARGEDVNDDKVPAGQVVSQTPADGALLRGDQVKIVVSKGPVLVAVPAVVGQSGEQAEKTLTDLGFQVKKEYPFGSALFDQVRVQSVPEGQQIPKGSVITLTIV